MQQEGKELEKESEKRWQEETQTCLQKGNDEETRWHNGRGGAIPRAQRSRRPGEREAELLQPGLDYEVKDARASKRPAERVAVTPMDQKKLMLHMDWDKTTLVVQNEKYLTMAEDDSYDGDAQVSWQALVAINTEELQEWLKKQDKGGDIIMVVQEKDLAVRAMQRVLYPLQPEGLGVLLLMGSEAALFPKVSDIVGVWP